MSTTVDNRVVEMRFDNQHFESNVKTTMSTLDKLKQSLNLTGATKGLENVDKASRSINFTGLGTAVDGIQAKFSAMGVVGTTALVNIANQAVNTGKRMLSALTIDPITTGLSEYETKINSVQTILANTQSKGSTIDDVTAVLNELNEYADMTIYNFAEMTKNIGTFTAAGVGLEESAAAIKGIANLAAASGSSSMQASTAMYQLSQALAAGRVSLMDWNSVVNAGMGGELFQEALKRTARNLGTGVDEAIAKYGTFRESLTRGEWLTAEVLTETLSQIAGAYDEAELKAQGYTDEQVKQILQLAETATDAATKVKTFTQLWDTMKESAQSGWAQTWELIIGDFEEAKEFLTGLSDIFNGIIGESANNRNQLISGAMNSNWDKLVTSLTESGISNDEFTSSLTKSLEKHGYKVDEVITKYGSLEKAFRSGEISSDILQEAVDGLGGSMVDLSDVTAGLSRSDGLEGYNEDVAKVQETLKALGYDLGTFGDEANGVDGVFGEMTENAIRNFQEMNGLEVTGIVDQATLDKLEELNTKTVEAKSEWQTFIDGIDQMGGRELLLEGFMNILNSIIDVCGAVKEAWQDIFPPATSEQLYNLIEKFHKFTEGLKLNQGMMNRVKIIFKGLFSVLDIVRMAFMGVVDALSPLFGGCGSLIDTITVLAAKWATWVIGLRDSMKETDFFTGAFQGLKTIIQTVSDAISNFADILKGGFDLPDISSWFAGSTDGAEATGDKLGGLLGIIQSVWNGIKGIATAIGDFIGGIFGSIGSGLENNGFAGFLDVLDTTAFGAIAVGLGKFFMSLSKAADSFGGFKEIFESIGDLLKAQENAANAKALLTIAGAIGVLAVSLLLISSIDEDKLTTALLGITALFGELMGSMALFNKIGNPTGVIRAIGFMVGISVAVLILSAALKSLSDLDLKELAIGVIGVAALMKILVNAVESMTYGSVDIIKGAGQLILIAAAIKILASACMDLATLSWGGIAKGLVGVGALLLALSKFSKSATISKDFISVGVGIMAIAVAMKIFASAIADFGSMNWSDIAKGLVGIAGSLAIIVVAMKRMPEADMISIGVGLAAIAVALKILVSAMRDVAGMSLGELAKGLIGIAGAFAILVIGLRHMEASKDAATSLLVTSAALLVMSSALKRFGSMSVGSIVKSFVVLAGAFAIIGLAAKILQPLLPAISTLAISFALIGGGALLLGLGLTAIGYGLSAIAVGVIALVSAISGSVSGIVGTIFDIVQAVLQAIIDCAPLLGEAVTAIVLMLVDVLVECVPVIADGAMKLIVGLLDSLIEYAPQIVERLFDFIIVIINSLGDKIPELVIAVMDFIGKIFQGVLDAIGGLSFESVANALIGVGLLAALVAAISFITPLIPTAMTGVLGLGAIAAELTLVLAALGGIAQIPGLTWLVDEGGALLQSIGEALGGFVGGIVGGFAEGVSDSFPAIGTNLSNFMTNVQPFIDGAKGIDQTALDGVANLSAMILMITGADLLNSIAGFITGGSSLESFGTELVSFGNAMKDYSVAVSGIDIQAIADSAVAGMWLSVLANSLPNCGGLISFFTGDNTMDSFATQIVAFGKGIREYSTEVAGIDTAAIAASAAAGMSLATLATHLPNCGGLFSLFTGEQDLSKFAEQIGPFGTAIKDFSTNVSGINAEAITAAANAGQSLVNLATNLPNCGGLFSLFTGDQDLGKFAEQIAPFGTAIKEFSTNVNGINAEAITAAANAGGSLATLASNLPNCGGLISFFTGENSLDKFSEQIGPFGTAIKEFSTNVDGINGEAITAAANAGGSLATLASNLPSCGGLLSFFTGETMDLETFSSQMGAFGSGIKEFSTNVSGINAEAITAAAGAGESLATLANKLPSCGGLVTWFTGETMDMETFGSKLPAFGTGIKAFSDNVNGINAEAITAAAGAAESLVTLANKLPSCGGLVTWFTGETMDMETFGSKLPAFGTAIKTFSDNVAGIDPEVVTAAATAGESLSTLASNLPETGGIFSVFTGDTDMEKFGSQLKTFGTGIKDFATEVSGINPDTVTAAANAGKVLAEIANALPEDGGVVSLWSGDSDIGSFGSQLKSFGTGVKDFYNEVSGVDSTVLGNIITNIENLDAMIGDLATLDTSGVSSFVTAIDELGDTNISDLITAFENAGTDLATAVNSMIITGLGEVTNNQTLFSESGRLMVNWISNGINENATNIVTSFQQLITSLLNVISNAMPVFQTGGQMLMGYFSLGVLAGSETVGTTISTMISNCVTKIRDKYTSFKSAGQYLAQGFANGISADTWRAESKARAMANAAYKAAQQALDSHSPSRVFQKLGTYVPMGMAKGIESLSGMVEDSSKLMATNAINSTAGVLSRLGDMVESDIDTQPTIRPVLDLTDVESKASTISSLFGTNMAGTISVAMNQQLQNGKNADVVSAINGLYKKLDGIEKPSYNINGITYDDGSNIAMAVGDLIRAANIERRS